LFVRSAVIKTSSFSGPISIRLNRPGNPGGYLV
jgi:hypothetical protein